MAANGPLPTNLTLLTSLPTHSSGSKVRFLGCIDAYNSRTGSLLLTHAYHPPSVHGKSTDERPGEKRSGDGQAGGGSNVRAIVDVNVIVETMKREDLERGAWVNVVGYVQGRRKRGGGDGEGGKVGVDVDVDVQATMVWGAGSVRLGRYERAVAERVEVEGK